MIRKGSPMWLGALLAPLIALLGAYRCAPAPSPSQDDVMVAFQSAHDASRSEGSEIDATIQVSKVIKIGDGAEEWTERLRKNGFSLESKGSPNSLNEPEVIIASKNIGRFPAERNLRIIYGIRSAKISKVWARSFLISMQ